MENLDDSIGGAVSHRHIMHRYLHTVGGDGCFDPETVITLGAAFDDAWRSLEKSGAYFRCSPAVEAMRERLAQRIVECAKRGERDAGRLRDDALLDLATANLTQLNQRTGTGT